MTTILPFALRPEKRRSRFAALFENKEAPTTSPQPVAAKAQPRQQRRASSVGYEDQVPLPFVYPEFQKEGQIRLLRLPTEPETVAGIGQCYFTHVDISDPPPYTAVSYAWDISGKPSYVVVNSQYFPIQNTVSSLLHSLSQGAAGGSRLVWIDAICINQSDVEERNKQVRLMSEIYSRANYVIAWMFSSSSLVWDIFDIGLRWIKILASDDGAQHMTTLEKHAVNAVLRNSYWTRLWILQEVTLARTIILKSPNTEIPFAMLGRLFDSLALAKSSMVLADRFRLHNSDLSLYLGSPARKVCILRNKERNVGVATLRDLLSTYRSHQCNEARDRVFALLSLSEKAKKHFKVDYAIDLIDLAQQVIDFSIDIEDMPDFETVSHAQLVEHALRIDKTFISSDRRYGIDCCCRGTVLSLDLDLDPSSEDRVMNVRSAINGFNNLKSFDFLKVDQSESYHCYMDSEEAESLYSSSSMTWSHDLCCFTFEENGKVYICLASSWVKIGDEIWQFQKTAPVLLARPTPGGFSIFGRAFILNEQELARVSPNSIWRPIKCIWDDPSTNHHRRSLSVDFNCLMILTKLADERF